MKPFVLYLIGLLLPAVLLGCEIVGGDDAGTAGDFALYLVEEEQVPDLQTPLEALRLAPQPFLADSDLTAYVWREHRMTYPPAVHARLQAHGDLYNRRFVVTVGDERVYQGWFTSMISSRAFMEPVIMLGLAGPGMPFTAPAAMVVERGYPAGMGPADAPDPRADPRIRAALKACNRLR